MVAINLREFKVGLLGDVGEPFTITVIAPPEFDTTGPVSATVRGWRGDTLAAFDTAWTDRFLTLSLTPEQTTAIGTVSATWSLTIDGVSWLGGPFDLASPGIRPRGSRFGSVRDAVVNQGVINVDVIAGTVQGDPPGAAAQAKAETIAELTPLIDGKAPGSAFNPPPAAPGDGPNVIVGEYGAIAPDVGTAAVLAGGSPGYENVVGGDTSTVNTPTPNEVALGTGADWAVIIAGYDNVNNGAASQVAGYHVKVESAATHATVGGGSLHSVTDGDYSTIGGGTQHQIAANSATIGGGSQNTITDPAATRATIAGGGDNTAAGYASTVGGGENNNAAGTGTVVSGGVGNSAVGNYASVGGGQGNSPSGNYATAAGGQNNVTSGSYSTVGGGTANQATQTGATVAGGQTNQATGNSATVGGGLSNIAGPGTAATVPGGRGNVAAGASATAFGREASAPLEGQVAHASGFFAVAGDAQESVLVLRRVTTDATVSELFLNGASGRMTLLPDSTWAFSILVVARRADANGESAGYKFEGVCDRDSGGSTALVGAVTKTVLAEDQAAWDCEVDVDAATFSLRIRVTGEAAKTIRWVARVGLAQVSG